MAAYLKIMKVKQFNEEVAKNTPTPSMKWYYTEAFANDEDGDGNDDVNTPNF